MKLLLVKGTASKLLQVFVQDSSSTTGVGLTGLVFNTASLSAYYYREGAGSAVAITLATMTLGTWATGGFVVVDGTNMPGVYQLGIPDAALATGANSVVIMLKGAANMAPVLLEIQLTDANLHDAVRLGLTALPNAAAEAAGGLFTRGTGAGQINQAANGMVDTNPVRLNNVSQSLLDLKDFADDGYDPTTNKVAGVVLTDTVTTYTGNTLQTGDSFARLGAPAGASVSADLAAIEAQTDDIGTAGAGLTAVPWNIAWDAEVESEVADALAVYDPPTFAELTTATANLDAAVSTRATPAQVNTEVDTAIADARLDELLAADSDIDGAAPPTVGSVIHELLSKTAGSFTFDQTTDSLEALRDNLATAAALATVQADTDDIQARLPAALVSGRIDVSVGAMATDVLTAASLNTDAVTEIQAAVAAGAVASVTGAVGSVTGSVGSVATGGITSASLATDAIGAAEFSQAAADKVWASTTRTLSAFGFSVTVGTNSDKTGYTLSAPGIQAIWDALTAALTTVGSIGKLLVDNINATIGSRLATAGYTTPPTAAAVADQVWDETLTDHLTGGSTGSALNAAGAAGDPWTTALPGVYGAGTAGKIVGDNINATVGSRATQVSVDTIDDFLDTEVAAIKVKTDNLPTDPADQSAVEAALLAVCAAIQLDTDDIQTRLPAALVSGRMDASVGAMAANTITAASLAADAGGELADAVWDEALAGHAGVGSAGSALSAAGLAADPWSTALPAAYGAGTAGKILGDNLNATVGSRATPAQVNTEMLDVLVTDTFPEPSAVPGATSSLKDRIAFLAANLRNKRTQSETTQVLRNDSDSAAIATWAVSDTGTVTTVSEAT